MSWESSYDNWKTTPPDDPDPVLTDENGCGIWEGEKYWDIDGLILSEESLEECAHFIGEIGETFTCPLCEETYGDDYDGKYYLIDGEKFCQDCIENYERTAYV